MFFILLMAILLFAITAYLISGHGGWLVSGYNTASPEEKKQYDEKKLCRWVGLGIMLPTDLMFLVLVLQQSTPIILWASAVYSIYIVGIIIIGNIKGFGKINP